VFVLPFISSTNRMEHTIDAMPIRRPFQCNGA
jgi:hypothetical protein